MNTKIKALIILTGALLITSCSPRLVGTWNVQKYETNTAGERSVSLQDIGSMTFYRDGSGDKQVEYSVVGITKKDTLPFSWVAAKKQVTINSDNSDFSKTWIRIEDKRNYQKWKSTDGSNQIQLLELAK